MIDPKTGEEIKTPKGDGQPLEKQSEAGDDTPKTDAPEEETLSKEEIEKLKKKAADFDGLVEKQRLAKLNKQSEAPKTDEAILKQLEENNARLAILEKEKADNALTEAYKEFTTEMPWANGDEYFDKISADFSGEGLTKKEEFVSKLKALAISKFPAKFAEYEGNKLKAKVLAEASNINAGGGSSATNNEIAQNANKQKTDEEKMKEKMAALFAKTKPRGR